MKSFVPVCHAWRQALLLRNLIGAAVNASEIQIWTDIDGMHNNDPRHFLFEQSEKVFSVGADVVEVRLDDFQTFLFILLSCVQFINVLFIFSLQLIDNLVGTLRILLIQIVRNFHQCVCRTRL